jgi:hypothetical protein
MPDLGVLWCQRGGSAQLGECTLEIALLPKL